MRFFFTLLALVAVTAVASANHMCGPDMCHDGGSCILDCQTNIHQCLPRCDNVVITQHVVNQWTENNQQMTHVEVNIQNNGPRDVKNIILGTDGSMQIRDDSSIWNVVHSDNGDLSFPSYITPLRVGDSYTFGYINRGGVANLWVRAVDLL
eukprot:gene17022-20278_t